MQPETQIHIEGVIFDYGNVLCQAQHPSDVAGMAAICRLPVAQFDELYWRLRPAYDLGEMDGTSYWNSLAGLRGRSLTGDEIARLIVLDCESWARPNEETVGWVERLHSEGVRLALLSNMPLEISRFLAGSCRALKCFDDLIYSCDVGSMKPDPRIYNTCLAEMKLEPGEVLFLDDRSDNVDAASALGIHSLLFDTVESTSRRAKRFDLPPPPDATAGAQ
jgi:putative hydrolase of the HAD superfamily